MKVYSVLEQVHYNNDLHDKAYILGTYKLLENAWNSIGNALKNKLATIKTNSHYRIMECAIHPDSFIVKLRYCCDAINLDESVPSFLMTEIVWEICSFQME